MSTSLAAHERTFTAAGDFAAMRAAEAFLASRGFSFGPTQGDAPRAKSLRAGAPSGDWSVEERRGQLLLGNLREAAERVIAERMRSVIDHKGKQHGMEDHRGEMLWLVPFEAMAELEKAL